MSAPAVRRGWCSHLGRPRGMRFLRCTTACVLGRVYGRLECVKHLPVILADHRTVADASTDLSVTSRSLLLAAVAAVAHTATQDHQLQITSAERTPPHRCFTVRPSWSRVPMKTVRCHLKRIAKRGRHETIRSRSPFRGNESRLMALGGCVSHSSNSSY